jgi:hypothetical protein
MWKRRHSRRSCLRLSTVGTSSPLVPCLHLASSRDVLDLADELLQPLAGKLRAQVHAQVEPVGVRWVLLAERAACEFDFNVAARGGAFIAIARDRPTKGSTPAGTRLVPSLRWEQERLVAVKGKEP